MSPKERARITVQDCKNFMGAGACPACIADAIRAAVNEEREACAKIADNGSVIEFADTMRTNEASRACLALAKAIRARKP